MSKKALILTWDQFQDHETIYPYYRVQEEGFEVDVFADKIGRIHGILGVHVDCTKLVSDFNDPKKFDQYMEEYDFLIIPGGVKSLEKLRQEKNALKFVHDWDSEGKTIACVCHGAQILISAKITKGREVSAYYSIKDDVENSGAIYVDAPAVISRNLVTSPHYKWLGQWMKAALEVYYKSAKK